MRISTLLKASSLVLMLGMTTQLSAAPVDLAAAKATAKQYLQKQVNNGMLKATALTDPVLLKQEMGDVNKTTPVYYIFNTATNYVVVSGDDRAEEVLMVGDKPLTLDRMPEGMKEMLSCYKQELDWLLSNPNVQVTKPSQQEPMLRAVTGTYGPLLTCNWDQETPYNNLCKFTYNGTTYTCLTGCPATSASMVMYYWKWPKTATGNLASYTSTLSLSNYSTVNFTYPALSSVTFDWDNMKDSYSGSYTNAQGTAVATLMRYVGQKEKMMYGTSSAGGSGIYTSATQDIVDMYTYFGYDATTCRVVQKSSYSETNWANLLQEEMAAGRPVVFMAVSTSGGGHAFNVDGFRSSDTKYHVNFGWSGDGNAWCSMNSFGYSGYTFNSGQQMVIGIQPPATNTPTITANPTSLTFSGQVGNTYTQNITVTGTNLEGDVTAAISGNSAFTINKTSISESDATNGTTITVTYTPTAAGTHNATLTLSSSNATNVTVSITGTATAPAAVINVSQTAIDFGNVNYGSSSSKTFTVTGSNLTSAVTLTLTDANGVFSISPSVITAAQATQGATVTVSFNPEEVKNFTGSILLTATNATAVTVNLTGACVLEKGDLTLQEASDITSTSFKASWTDNTPAANVTSYTLWVNQEVPNVVELLSSLDGSQYTGSYANITLSAPWGGTQVKAGNGAIYVSNANNTSGVITYTIPEGYNNATFSMRITTGTSNYSTGNITVKSTQTAAVGHTFAKGETYTWLVTGSTGETISITSTDASYGPDMALLEVYSGDVTQTASLNASETGDATQRVITGITQKMYTVLGLTPEATYYFKVKAIYADGTESDWTDTKQVTLLAEQQGLRGDINLDGKVDVTDLNILIAIMMGEDDAANYDRRAYLTDDDVIDVSDINELVSIMLGTSN